MSLHLNAWLFKCETQTMTPSVCLFPLTNKGNFLQGYLVTLHISVGTKQHTQVSPFLSFQVCSSEGYAAFLMTHFISSFYFWWSNTLLFPQSHNPHSHLFTVPCPPSFSLVHCVFSTRTRRGNNSVNTLWFKGMKVTLWQPLRNEWMWYNYGTPVPQLINTTEAPLRKHCCFFADSVRI